MKKKRVFIYIGIIILIVLDQITKFIVVKNFELNESVILIKNFLRFLYIRNTGAAFGIFKGNLVVLILFSIVLLYYVIKELNKGKDILNLITYSLIFSGAVGNLIDRVFRKYVVDFISFTILGHDMAIFNVADMYITFGVILFIINMIKEGKNERSSSK